MKVIQLTDYYPAIGENYLNDEDEVQINKFNGRIRKVVRKKGKVLKPIGIVGNCITKSIQSGEANIITAEVLSGYSTRRFLKEKMHYSESEASRMTLDRKSYCGFTLMNRTQTDVLGVLFFDSSNKKVFSDNFIEKVEMYLPRVGEILVS